MPRRRPTRTGNARKGKKLKGLTPQEGHERAVKGWRTKRQKGLYAHEEPPMTGGSSEAPHRRRSESIYDSTMQNVVEHDAPGMSSHGSWEEFVNAQARHVASGGTVSAEFADVMKGADDSERKRFIAKVERQKIIAGRMKRMGTEVEDPMIGSRGRKGEAEYVEKTGRQRLHRVINKDMREPGIIREVRIDPEIGEYVDKQKVNEAGVRSETRRAMRDTFYINDPVHGKKTFLIEPDRLKALEEMIVKSHFAGTENERARHARLAENLTNQLIQQASRRAEARGGAAQLADEALPRGEDVIRKGFKSPEVSFEDLPKEVQDHYEARLHAEHSRAIDIEGQRPSYKTAKALYNAEQSASNRPGPLRQDLIPHEKRLGASAEGMFAASKQDAKGIQGIKNQIAFEKTIAKNKRRSLKEGTLTAGYNAGGGITKPEGADFRVSPNKVWEYELRDPTASNPHGVRTQHLPYWDTQTQHALGHRNLGKLAEGEHDEMISEELVPRFRKRAGVTFGDRQLKNPGPKDDWVDREHIIPLAGAKTVHKRIAPDAIPDGQTTMKRVVQMRAADGQWHDADPNDPTYRDAVAYERHLLSRGKELGPNDVRTRTTDVPKSARITYADPSALKNVGSDYAYFVNRRPHTHTLGYVDRVGEAKLKGKASDAAYRWHAAGQEATLRRRSEAMHEQRLERAGVPPTDSRKRTLLEAGAAAAYYGTRKRVYKGYAPYYGDKAVQGLKGSHPKITDFMDKHVPNAGIQFDQAFVRPGAEHIANKSWQFWHPMSSAQFGTTGGVEWGNAYLREGRLSRFLPTLKEGEVERRHVVKAEKELDRLANTRSYISKNAYRGLGPDAGRLDRAVGRFHRKRGEVAMRRPEYQNFYSETRGVTGGTLLAGKSTLEGVHDYAIGEMTKHQGINEAAFNQAAKLAAKVKQLEATEAARPIGGAIVHVPKVSRSFALSSGSKGMLVGGALVGSAIGAHYLYHRHQQSKLPQSQRETYFDAILPHRIEARVPYVRSHGHLTIGSNAVTREFELAGKKLPLGAAVGTRKKTIWQGTPSDRGYHAAKSGLTGVRLGSPAKGGQLSKSVFFDFETGGNLRRTYKRPGGQLSVLGHKLPIKADIGRRRKIELSGTNPRRITNADRENAVWALGGTRDQASAKRFYGPEDRIQEMFTPHEVARIRREKGATEVRQAREKPYRARSYIDMGDPKGKGAFEYGDLTDKERTKLPGQHLTVRDLFTGGTGGVDPYSQIGHTHRKHEEHFEQGARPTTSMRTRQPVDASGKKIGREVVEIKVAPPKSTKTSRPVGRTKKRPADIPAQMGPVDSKGRPIIPPGYGKKNRKK